MPVFGADERKEAWEAPEGKRDLFKSICAIVRKNDMRLNERTGRYEIRKPYTLEETLMEQFRSKGVDPNFKYLSQPAVADSTGFVVARDIVMITGHSLFKYSNRKPGMGDLEMLGNYYVVFGWQYAAGLSGKDEYPQTIAPDDVFTIDRAMKLTPGGELAGRPDFVLVRLDRSLPLLRPPLTFAAAAPQIGSSCWVAGYPLGLPLKYVEGAVQDIQTNPEIGDFFCFQHSLTVFGGNSGSPIFNDADEIIGIHSRSPEGHFFVNQTTQLIEPKTLTLASPMNHMPCGIRTDSIQWFINPNARFQIQIRLPTNAPPSPAPIDLEIEHERTLPGNRTHRDGVIGRIRDIPTTGIIEIDCNVPAPADGRIPPFRPYDFHRLIFRLDPNGPANPIQMREFTMIRVIFSNPNDGSQRVELWRGIGAQKGLTVVFGADQVAAWVPLLEDPIWSTPAWPPARKRELFARNFQP